MAKITNTKSSIKSSTKSMGGSKTTTQKYKIGNTNVVDTQYTSKNASETTNRTTNIISTKKTKDEYAFSLLSLPTFIVVFFLIIAGGTFNHIMTTDGLGSWSLKEEYQIQHVYTHNDLIDLQLDTPITELNNHSLREVFEDGNLLVNDNFSDGATGWATNSNLVVTDEIGRFIGLGDSNIIVIAPTINDTIHNAKYYLATSVKYDGNIQALWLRTVGSVDNEILEIDTITLNSWKFISGVGTLTTSTLGIQILGFYPNSSAQLNNSVYVDNMIFLNLSTYGIDTLTVSQMDYWYNVYQDVKNGEIHEETKLFLGTIDYRNPINDDGSVIYKDYYHIKPISYEQAGNKSVDSFKTLASLFIGDDEKGTPGIFPLLQKVTTSIRDGILWIVDNLNKLFNYFDKGYESVTGETLNETWKRTRTVWDWLSDSFGIVGGAS